MEELKLTIEALSGLGDAALSAFIIYCIKDLIVYTLFPITLIILAKIGIKCYDKYVEDEIRFEELKVRMKEAILNEMP